MKSGGAGLLTALTIAGCIPTPRVGMFAPDAVYMVRDHYRVTYAAPGTTDLLDAEWEVENFERDGASRSARWTTERWRSVTLDGGAPVTTERFDLRLTHRLDGSLVFSQTIPVGAALAGRTLEELAHEAADRAADQQSFDFDWSAPPPEHRDVLLIAHGPVVVDGVAGHGGSFDAGGGLRVSFVVLRPSARWTREPEPYWQGASGGWPMLVVFGCVSPIAQHTERREALEALLRRVDFHETP